MRNLTSGSKCEIERLLHTARTTSCQVEADRSLVEYGAILGFMLRENFISPTTYSLRFDEMSLIRAQRFEAQNEVIYEHSQAS